jgi:hypothetical protein
MQEAGGAEGDGGAGEQAAGPAGAPSSGDAQPATHSVRSRGPAAQSEEEGTQEAVLRAALTAQLAILVGENYGYTVADLHLENMSLGELQALQAYLESGKFPLGDVLQHVDALQRYWGYDNARMISALREIYYADALNAFIWEAGAVDSSIYAVSGDRSGITQSQAALGVALLLLSKQGHEYRDPILTTDFPAGYSDSGEFGFDHVISGLDGFAHPQTGVHEFLVYYGTGLPYTVLERITSTNAVTWLGDLIATVGMGINYSRENDGVSGYGMDQAAQDGYALEMPLQDFNGDVFALAIVQSGQFNPAGQNLSQVLAQAFDPGGDLASQRYSLFAANVGLAFDPETGELSAESRAQFIENYLPIVSAMGVGFYNKSRSLLSLDLNSGNWALPLAEANVNRFLDEFEARLQQEVQAGEG